MNQTSEKPRCNYFALSLRQMPSPIRHILPVLPYAVVNVAIEKEKEFIQNFPEYSLEVTNDQKPFAKSLPEEKHVIYSRGIAEFCWCASYSYPILYDFIAPKCGVSSGTILDLYANESTRDAINLLDWSIGNATGHHSYNWPINLPMPKSLLEESDREDPLYVAQDFCLISLASIVLHELGHSHLQHRPTKDNDLSIEQEKEADQFSFNWILGSPNIDKIQFGKRAIGIAISLLAFVAKEIYSPTKVSTHPAWFNRFFYFADTYFFDDPSNIVWAIAVVFLGLHMKSVDLPANPEVEGTLRDKVIEYLDTISRSL